MLTAKNKRFPIVSMLSSLFLFPCSGAFADVQSKIESERRQSAKYDPVEGYRRLIDESKRLGDSTEKAPKSAPFAIKIGVAIYKAGSDSSQAVLEKSKDDVGRKPSAPPQ